MLSCHKADTESRSHTRRLLWIFVSRCLRGEILSTRDSTRVRHRVAFCAIPDIIFRSNHTKPSTSCFEKPIRKEES